MHFMSVIYPLKSDKSNPLEKKTLRALLGPIFGDILGVYFSPGPIGGLFGGPLRSHL